VNGIQHISPDTGEDKKLLQAGRNGIVAKILTKRTC